MENEEHDRRKKTTFTEEEKRKFLFTAQEMFVSKGKTRLRWPPRNILVPLDGVEEGKRALPYITEIAKTYKSKVTLVTIARPFQWSLATPSIPPPTTAALENHLIPLIMEMRVKGVDVVFGIMREEREKAIKNLVDSTKADLVVIVNRYRNPWVRYLKGKKLSPLIDGLRVPLIVI